MKQLMHPRETGNYSSKGYYPTDNDTISSILSMINPGDEQVKLLDPCAGTGEALLRFKEKLPNSSLNGIEIDEERAAIADLNLDKAIKSSVHNTHVSLGSVNCIFLNPPYGRSMKGQLDDNHDDSRIEHHFVKKCFGWLAPKGILVYIIPKSQMTDKMIKYLICRFKNPIFFSASVDTYNQVVFMGEKLPNPRSVDQEQLTKIVEYRLFDRWPTRDDYDIFYNISLGIKKFSFYSIKLTIEGINKVKDKNSGLWPQFKSIVGQRKKHSVVPLHNLTDWHISLLITSGLISGVVDNGNQRLLIKGKTVKIKKTKHYTEETEGCVNQITEKKDVFKTVMKAVVLNPGSEFGKLLTIK